MKLHWFYILLSISSSPRYGTAVQEDVHELSGGAVRLWPATLYGSLEELVTRGWIEEIADSDRPGSITGRERFYRLTESGREALRTELERMESRVGAARARLDGERNS